MDYKKQIIEFADKIDAVKGKLVLATKSDAVYKDVVQLAEAMHSAIEGCSDEMFCAALYNAAATIRTAPESCPVFQMSEALEEASCELRMMSEYFDN